MTDPTGISFLSYKRERANEARLVLEAKQDRGIPTWQDVSDLPHTVTETALEEVLNDQGTASAVLLITPEVEDSNIIRDLEIPLILTRQRTKDGFVVVPVVAGGLDYKDVSNVVGPRVRLTNMSGFNMQKAPTNPLDATFAAIIAKAVLDARMQAIASALPVNEPLRIQVSTRIPLPKEPGFALRLDLRHRFDGRFALPNAWVDFILPSFVDVVETIQRRTSGRDVILSGFPSIPAATALGAAFLSLGGLRVSWLQEQNTFGLGAEQWGLHVPNAASGFIAEECPESAAGTDYALLVSATTDVVDDFRLSTASLPLRATIHIALETPRLDRIHLGPGEAAHIARLAVNSLRNAWGKYGKRGTVHLFLAVPAGVAFMIGQQLNTFGAVQTYEHSPSAAIPYVPAALLHPSNGI